MAENEETERSGGRRYLKGIVGGVGPICAVIGALLGLGVIHPFGHGGTSVAQAAVKTIDEGTSRVTLTMKGPLPNGGRGTLFKGDGEIDYRLNRGRFTYDYSQLAAASNGQVPNTIEAILDDNLMYVKLPRPAGGKQWLEIDLVQLYKQQLGVDVGPLLAYDANPTRSLQNLQASGKIDKVGEERLLDGTEATHYRGVVDLHKVADQAPPDVRAGLRRSVDALVAKGAQSQLPADVWIGDGDGLVHRLDLQVAAGGQQLSVEMELYDFGVSVDATPPPASEVATPAQLAAAGAGG